MQDHLHQERDRIGGRSTAWPQAIRFCRAPDGSRLGFATAGVGDPIVTIGGFATHLEYDQEHPVFGPVLAELQGVATYLRYDERGDGLSQGKECDDTLHTRVSDLETVIDAAGLDRFTLFAASMGGPVAIAYAVRHPDRVSRLILAATYARGPAVGREAKREAEAFARLISLGWGRGPRLRRILSTGLWPGATEETIAWLDDHQAALTSGDTFASSYLSRVSVDVSALLQRVSVPTLVLHTRDDMLAGFDEGWRMASGIPGARLVTYDSGGHVWPERGQLRHAGLEEVAEFLSKPVARASSEVDRITFLSASEAAILDLASYGMSNTGMADRLCLSVRTVERHMSNIYLKLRVSGTTARTAAVGMYLRRSGAYSGPPPAAR